jgi:hypothetical protein
MSNNEPENMGSASENTPDPALERDLLELKLRAELGMLDSFSSDDIPPEMQKMFLQQVYDFEKNFAEGTPKTFAETLATPAFDPWPVERISWEAGEEMVTNLLQWYKDNNIAVSFEFEYPPSVKYDFLAVQLPGLPNYYGSQPGMLTGVFYEEYFPNHGATIESNALNFMEAFFGRNAEDMKDVIWRDQMSIEKGPYDGLLLIEYFEKWFASLSGFEKYDYTILETSYEWYDGDGDESEAMLYPTNSPGGMGYAEGFVGYIAESLIESEPIRNVGPFKLYFEWRYGFWGIILSQFPGLPIPPEG